MKKYNIYMNIVGPAGSAIVPVKGNPYDAEDVGDCMEMISKVIPSSLAMGMIDVVGVSILEVEHDGNIEQASSTGELSGRPSEEHLGSGPCEVQGESDLRKVRR